MKMIVEAEWREDYFAAWPNELDIGFGLTLPAPTWLWDDFWLGEVLKGNLAWDDPLRQNPLEAYRANGISLFEDEMLFVNDDPERALSIHDPGRAKRNDGRFDDLMKQIKQRNIAAAEAERAQEVPRAV